MASSHHHTTKKAILEVFKILSYDYKRDISLVEKVKQIKINDPDSKEVIEYEPDFIMKRNISKNSYYYIIFEIIDSQEDIKTMADIARILAKQEVKRAIFITFDKKKTKETSRVISVLVGSYKERFKKKNRKDIIEIANVEILKLENEGDYKKIVLDILDKIIDLFPKPK